MTLDLSCSKTDLTEHVVIVGRCVNQKSYMTYIGFIVQ